MCRRSSAHEPSALPGFVESGPPSSRSIASGLLGSTLTLRRVPSLLVANHSASKAQDSSALHVSRARVRRAALGSCGASGVLDSVWQGALDSRASSRAIVRWVGCIIDLLRALADVPSGLELREGRWFRQGPSTGWSLGGGSCGVGSEGSPDFSSVACAASRSSRSRRSSASCSWMRNASAISSS